MTCTESIEKRKVSQDNCVSCHMPGSGTIDIPHVISTDHYIRKPAGKNEIEAVKKFIRLRCINETNPPAEEVAKAYINYYEKFVPNKAFLDSAANYLAIEKSTDIQKYYKTLIHLAYLKEDYDHIISLAEKVKPLNFLKKKSWSNEDAYAAYRTGDAYFNRGKMESAGSYFRRAIDLSPYIPEFRNRYGSVLMNTGNTRGAQEIFEALKNENKNFVPAISNLGYAVLMNDGNSAMAMQLYNKALDLDPDYESAVLNKAGLYIYQQNFSSARKILSKFAERKPGNKQVRDILESIKNMKDKTESRHRAVNDYERK